MNVLLLDTETQGIDEKEHAVIEVACTLYSLTYGAAIESYASLIGAEGNPAEHVNGISPELLAEEASVGMSAVKVWDRVMTMSTRARCIAAHRAEFDQRFVRKACSSLGNPLADHLPWVCTKTDICWPGDRQGDSLVQLALSLGLGVASAHRAMADVDTMSRILTRVHEIGVDLEELFTRAMRPKKRFVAMVSYERRDLAKKAGFLWDDKRREWWRMIPPEDVEEIPFRVVQRD